MSYFLKLSEVKSIISNHKYSKEFLDILDDEINFKNLIYYKDKNDIYIGTFISQNLKRGFIEKFNADPGKLPKFVPVEIQFNERFIIENGKEVNYDESKFKKDIDEKQKKFTKKVRIRNSNFNYSNLTKEEIEEYKEKKRLKFIESENKKVEKRRINILKTLDELKNALNEDNIFFSFDCEWYEINKNYLTEIGYSMFNTKTNKYENKNIVISENIDKNNGQYVPNYKFDFQFGETLILKEEDALKHIRSLIEKSDYLIGHDIKNDMIYFEDIEKKCFDTQKLFIPQDHGLNNKVIGLEKLAETLGLNPQYLHNAGNDAYFTLQSALKLAF